MSIDEIIDAIIKREGRLVNNPLDHGGVTKFGITRKTLSEWRKEPVLDRDVELLEEPEARDIYRNLYIDKPGFNLIGSEALKGTLVDFAVNSGATTAIRALQTVLGPPIVTDGVLGHLTAQAANVKDGSRLSLKVLAERTRFYGRLIRKDRTQAVFAEGWLNRVADQIDSLV